MSVELDWSQLSQLSSNLVDLLNKHLTTSNRPSFIGPIEVQSLSFGTNPPDVEIVDVRDIYRDFLDADESSTASGEDDAKVGETRTHALGEEDHFEWVSRRGLARGVPEESPMYHHLPPHIRYGRGPSSASEVGGTPMVASSSRDPWRRSLSNLSELRRPPHPEDYDPQDGYPYSDFYPPLPSSTLPHGSFASMQRPTPTPPDDSFTSHVAPPPPDTQSDVQLHLQVSYHADVRITLTTSLLINYPSPLFMALPVKLSITGLVFNGEVVVAYQNSRKRVHVCILDELDPYGPQAHPRRHDSPPPDPNYSPPRPGQKPLPIGLRLLPTIDIESEIGQADKHVLKNVTRVERFIQDVIRKTVEEELVFPNFHTMVLGEE